MVIGAGLAGPPVPPLAPGRASAMCKAPCVPPERSATSDPGRLSVGFDATPLLGRPTGVGVFCAGALSGLAARPDARGVRLRGELAPPPADRRPGAGRGRRPGSGPCRPDPCTWRGRRFSRPPSSGSSAATTWCTGPTSWSRRPPGGPGDDGPRPDRRALPGAVRPADAGLSRTSSAGRWPRGPGCTPRRSSWPTRWWPSSASTRSGSGPSTTACPPLRPCPSPRTADRRSDCPRVWPLRAGRRDHRAAEGLPAAGVGLRRGVRRPPRRGPGLVGGDGWGVERFPAAVEASPARDRIVRPGYLDDAGLAAALRHASVLVYPSRYEGFGFPPLQAMAAGVPVVATAAGAVPEVVGDGALLAAPGDGDGLAGALGRVLDGGARYRRPGGAGPTPERPVHLGGLRRGSGPALRGRLPVLGIGCRHRSRPVGGGEQHAHADDGRAAPAAGIGRNRHLHQRSPAGPRCTWTPSERPDLELAGQPARRPPWRRRIRCPSSGHPLRALAVAGSAPDPGLGPGIAPGPVRLRCGPRHLAGHPRAGDGRPWWSPCTTFSGAGSPMPTRPGDGPGTRRRCAGPCAGPTGSSCPPRWWPTTWRRPGAPRQAITVIPMGSDHLPPPDFGAGAALLARLGVDGPFLLSVGTLEPRKNQPRLIEAYGASAGRSPNPGRWSWWARADGESRWSRPPVWSWPAWSRRPSSPRSTPWPASWPTSPSSRVSGFPRSRPWPSAPRWWPARCPSTAGAAFEVDPARHGLHRRGAVAVATDEDERKRLHRSGWRAGRRAVAGRRSPAATSAVWNEARRVDRPVASVADPALRLSLDVTAVPARPVGAGHYTMQLAAGPGRPVRRRSGAVRPTHRRGPVAGRWPRRRAGSARRPVPARSGWPGSRSGSRACWPARRVDVHHGPHYTMPERSSVPTVVTVHDLSFFEQAELARVVEGPAVPAGHHGGRPPGRGRGLSEPGHRRAAGPVVPGGGRGVRGPPRGRHRTVPTRRARARVRTPAAWPRWTTGWPTGRPYLLFVGTLEPRKDLPTLVGAFARVAGRHPEALLVLAGGAGWGAAAVDRAVEALRGRLPHRADRVRARRGRPRPAPVGHGRRLPGALRGVRAPRPRGAGLRRTAGHHRGHGHGGGGRRRRRAGRPGRRRRPWPTPSTLELAGRTGRRPRPGTSGVAAASRSRPRHTWEASAARHHGGLPARRRPAARGRPVGLPAPSDAASRVTRRALPHHRRSRLRRHLAGRPSPRTRRRGRRHRQRGGRHRSGRPAGGACPTAAPTPSTTWPPSPTSGSRGTSRSRCSRST